jgi:phosphoribosylanthranilate isomerase
MNVKICCISSIYEAEIATLNGADYIGWVIQMPSGLGIILDDEIAKIVKAVNGRIETVILTSQTRVKDTIKHHNKVNPSCIQFSRYS